MIASSSSTSSSEVTGRSPARASLGEREHDQLVHQAAGVGGDEGDPAGRDDGGVGAQPAAHHHPAAAHAAPTVHAGRAGSPRATSTRVPATSPGAHAATYDARPTRSSGRSGPAPAATAARERPVRRRTATPPSSAVRVLDRGRGRGHRVSVLGAGRGGPCTPRRRSRPGRTARPAAARRPPSEAAPRGGWCPGDGWLSARNARIPPNTTIDQKPRTSSIISTKPPAPIPEPPP